VNLASIPPHLPFLDTLAAAWLARASGDTLGMAEGIILLPTRRAARGLTEAFLRLSGGRPMLLPRIVALGGLDEAPLALAGALDMLPAVAPETRLAVLARLVMSFSGSAFGAAILADQAWPLAAELAGLLDEAARAEIDLRAGLAAAADAGFAAHWEQTIAFLRIVTDHWPNWLAENGLSDIAARQVALLRAQAASWEARPPAHPVWIAGTTGAIPAVARLLRVVVELDQGRVVLPGLDFAMPDEAWEALDPSHPQAGMQRLLTELGARRGDVSPESPAAADSAGRAAMLGRALLPAAALDIWQVPQAARTDGLYSLSPADQQEEAVAIALLLRGALEWPGARAALVTPDRELAARVAAELARFGVLADDSAGESLADTPPANFFRLLARAVADRLAPVPLLALLKHPYAAAGLSPAACRAAARALELSALRGPRPGPGFAGLRRRLEERAEPTIGRLLDRLEAILAPVLALAEGSEKTPAEALAALIAAAEALAGTDAEPGAAFLWAGEEGEALVQHFSALQDAFAALPPQAFSALPSLLDATLAGKVVRGRRALRGRDGEGEVGEHPRIFIWGLLEARLQAVDVVVLGGLAEGVWPAATEPGPWMSRPMRARVGLPSPEERIGQMAHDFVMTACGAPVAVLSCPRRRDGAPAVPARWLVRMRAMLGATALPEHPALAWARALDQPAGPARPEAPPAPCPPVALRPRRLRVTEIETWRRDPYAIYARHILRLRPVPPLEEPTDAADYGSLVHAGLRDFLEQTGPHWPADADAQLRQAMLRALEKQALRPALASWWRPRLLRIADWVAGEEIRRRAVAAPARVLPEIDGLWSFDAPAGPFSVAGRADRVELRADGRVAILDYKTGKAPNPKDVRHGYAPQLLIEAAMAEAGAFPALPATMAAELTYWELQGGFEPGRAVAAVNEKEGDIAGATVFARDMFFDFVASFDDPARPYLARPHPDAAPRFSDYAHLARVAEWEAAEDGA
jgi:ATP-dependent helicase/nuclease subunit B